jgi:Amt family ammonium transporter
MDDDQLGEFAYDYVEVRRDYLAWTPAKPDPEGKEYEIPQGERHGIQQHSEMLEGREPSETSGNEHTGIGGDRHAAAYEKSQREQDYQGQNQTDGQ